MKASEEFSNQVILPDRLPPIEVQEFVGLEEKYKLLKHISALIFLVVALGAFLIGAIFVAEGIPVRALVAFPVFFVILFVWRYILIRLGFPKKGYLLREKDLSYRSGLLFYKLTTIPFNRIQHVEVSQNVLEKSIGLSRVKIYTAGGSVSDLAIPGLLPDKAHQIESFLLSKVSTYE